MLFKRLGPREKFLAYVLPHLDTLYRCAVRLTGSGPDAEDLVQETCLRAFAGVDKLRDTGACKAWLFTIMHRTHRRCWMEDPYHRSVRSVEDLEAVAVDVREALYDYYEHDPVYENLVRDEIRQALRALPIPYREAVILAHIAQLSYREMAHVLRVPVGTVMSRLYRGRRLLQASLRHYARERAREQGEP